MHADQIGPYVLERLLGEGGHARVYLARDDRLDREVAIKVMHHDATTTPSALAEFLAEARTAAKLKHHGIVRVHHVEVMDDGNYAVVMEYVDGLPLSVYAAEQGLADRRWSFQRIAALMADVAESLQYVHEQGLVHRDLKPSNVLVDPAGKPHLLDFGLAIHDAVQYCHEGESAGTLPYMSPELIRGESQYLDGRTDIWSLGVVLYELLTRRRPFHGGRLRIADEIVNRQPKPPRQYDASIPQELEAICLRCLQKNVDARYTTAMDVAHELRCWLRRDSIALHDSSAHAGPAEPARWMRRALFGMLLLPSFAWFSCGAPFANRPVLPFSWLRATSAHHHTSPVLERRVAGVPNTQP